MFIISDDSTSPVEPTYAPSSLGSPRQSPVGFHLNVETDSLAPQDEQLRLLEAAKIGCFLQASLASVCTITHRFNIENSCQDA